MDPLSIKNIDAFTPDYNPGRSERDKNKAKNKKRKPDDSDRRPTAEEADHDAKQADGTSAADYLGTQVDLEA